MAPKRNYTKEQMAKAIEEVNRGVKVAVAAAKYGVPRITLRNKITGKSPLDCTLGPATILSNDEEKLLVEWLFLMSDNHFPVTKDHLLDSVQKIITEKNLDSCPFKDNRPGKKWFASFLKRHPEISERTAQNLTKARDDVSEDDLKEWFETNKKYIEERGLLDVLNDPNRIFNTDESAFYLQPKAGKVLVRKGEKNVYNSAGDDKENLTVLLTANAAGTVAPPMVVFPYERLPTLIVNSVPEDWAIGRSDSGWMNARTFYEYIANAFNPWLETHNIAKPILFFLDGHRSHMTLHLAEYCKSNGIEIIALYPNSTHLTQPMDVAVFRPLKVFWKNQVNQWKTEHPEKRFKKEDFAPNLKIALQNVTKDTIRNGFRKSGLHPFGIDYVDLTKLKSQSRAIVRTEQYKSDASQFMTFLESEIKSVFTAEKLSLFNQLYYMERTVLENILPPEDQSLYLIWAKVKHALTGVENVRCVDLPGRIESNECAIHPPTTDELQRTSESEEQVISTPQQQANEESQPGVSAEPNSSTSVKTQNVVNDKIQTQTISTSQQANEESQPEVSAEPKSVKTQNVVNDKIQTQTISTSQQANEESQPEVSAEPKSVKTQNVVNDKIQTQTISTSQQQANEDSQPRLNAEPEPSTSLKIQNLISNKIQPQFISTLQQPPNEETTPEVIDELPSMTNEELQIQSINETQSSQVLIQRQQTTPAKTSSSNTIPYPSSSDLTTPGGMIVPSPFKRALFWPEPDKKKRRTKERIPSAITGERWRAYMTKKENEKKRIEEEKIKRAKERQEKKILKENQLKEKQKKAKEKKAKEKKNRSKKEKKKNSNIPSSTSEEEEEIEFQDSEYDEREEFDYEESDTEGQVAVGAICTAMSNSGKRKKRKSSESDSENVPLAKMSHKKQKGSYVIIRYEGEYFPGIIENIDGDNFEVNTMVLSKGNTFRWPDTTDKLWYKKEDVVEYIQDPVQINKRGFYKVQEMEKHLPFIS